MKMKNSLKNLCALGVIALAVAAGWSLVAGGPVAAAPSNFVYRNGSSLMLNGSPYKFVGYNAFGVTGCEGSAWTRAQLDSYFSSLPPASMTRLWATEMYGTGTLDQVVASAEAHNQKVILTLNNDLNDCVGDGAKNNAWYQSGYKSGGYLNWVKQLASKYKNSAAIGMWEVINEAGQAQYAGSTRLDGATMKAFYQTVASTIKAIDPNHLVGTGDNAEFTYSAGTSGYATASSAADIDVLSLHDYESDYISNAPTISSHFAAVKGAADNMNKPLIIGEVNDNACKTTKSARAANVKKSVDSYLSSGAAGALVWNYSQVYYNDCGNNGEDYIVVASDPLHSAIKAYTIPGNVTTPTTGCTVPSNYGVVSSTLTIPADGVYHVWSRIMASSSANNSYSLEIDGKSCFVVGDSSAIPTNTWTWVNYGDGDTTKVIKLNLTRGTHTLRLIGREAGVKVDRVLALSDLACTPIGTGDQCAPTNADVAAPTVVISAPPRSATVSGTTAISANVGDNVGVSKVEFYVDATLVKTLIAAPYTYAWNTVGLANGVHTISVKAYDAAGNVGATTSSVTVANGDTQAPSAPTAVSASAVSSNEVTIAWAASSDNAGVTGYLLTRNGALLATVTNGTTFTDRTVAANTQYTYQLTAYDAVGNKSPASAQAIVKTPQQSTADTQAPSAPGNVAATAASSSQVNVSWKASTDNVAVTGYDVYRTAGGNTSKVSTVTGTTFGDSGLQASTAYSYHVIARDAAGNSSAKSASASATTTGSGQTGGQQPGSRGVFRGTVKNSSGQLLQGVTVTLWSSEGGEFKTTTNSVGVYRFDNLSTSAYFWATFSASGYQDQGMTIQVSAQTELVKNIQLQSANYYNWWQWW